LTNDNIRRLTDDVRKSPASIKRQLLQNVVCTVTGCGNPITHMAGPGSNSLCRDHQIYQREYGGMGRMDRDYSFHRKRVCIACGYNPDNDHRCVDMDDAERRIYARTMLIADHIIRRADLGGNHADNIQTLCLPCNAAKGVKNKDYLKRAEADIAKLIDDDDDQYYNTN